MMARMPGRQRPFSRQHSLRSKTVVKGSTASPFPGAGGKRFEMAHNQEWTRHTRPFVEAFFHARFFLEMAVKYGRELESAPTTLPSGWAALLCLYGMR